MDEEVGAALFGNSHAYKQHREAKDNPRDTLSRPHNVSVAKATS